MQRPRATHSSPAGKTRSTAHRMLSAGTPLPGGSFQGPAQVEARGLQSFPSMGPVQTHTLRHKVSRECERAPSAPKEAAAEKKGGRSLLRPAAPGGGLTAMQTPFHGSLYGEEELEEKLEKAEH